ncbi:LacI family DNA-binding transcriptional regulator [Pedobacter miscanthi]|uniref:LacI family transcriptional regulator n=1 Tax=Pedobacter miscanthi TaxID=2259170 RepID=A0A366LD25_9SPHI|nr:LacI family DNA-binding transcriptional regulator [Pedobacter miscanthi]RBQ11379.1 LacI family transcriptional regulator [Pedobacter miscanthi]
MTKKISIKDIAQRLNLSTTTVSFVINGKAKEKFISKEVTAKILNLVAEVGFRPNSFAKGLRTGKSKTIGFLVDHISDPFFSGIAHFLEEIAAKHGYKILFSSTGKEKTKFTELVEVFTERRVDGYIVATAVGMEEEVKKLVDSDVPIVLFDRYLPGIPADYVLVDNFASTYKATQHLFENGYHNCAFITTNTEEQQMTDRLEGYRDAVADHGGKEFIFKIKYEGTGSIVNAITSFLHAHPQIDAIIFAANYLTMEGLRALKKSNGKLRDDLALVSFDDFELLEFISPAITAIQQPMEKIAQHIMKLLLAKLAQNNDEDMFSTINIPCVLNIRESSAAKVQLERPSFRAESRNLSR